MRTTGLVMFALCYFSPIVSAAPVTPYHVIDVWYEWPRPTASLGVTMTVTHDPGLASAYYWSHFFKLEGARDGDANERQGYMGLQTSGGGPRAVIFSIWNALGASTGCETFGGEGVGFKCRIDYDWKVGHAYRFQAKAIGGDWWRGSVTDETTGVTTWIGDIQSPPGSGLAKSSVLFDEIYGPVDGCDAIPPARITFANLHGDGGMRPTHTGTTTPAPCAASGKVEMTGDTVIATTGRIAHDGLSSLRGWTLAGNRVTRGDRCLDAEGGKTTSGTRVIAWPCHGEANQRWNQRGGSLELAGTDQCVALLHGELRLAPCSLPFPMRDRPSGGVVRAGS